MTKNACIELSTKRVWDGLPPLTESDFPPSIDLGLNCETENVYFIRCHRLVKIGKTNGDVQLRLKSLQTGAPYPLTLYTWFIAPIGTEKRLHKRFSQFHSHLEWFYENPKLLKFMDGIKNKEIKK